MVKGETSVPRVRVVGWENAGQSKSANNGLLSMLKNIKLISVQDLDMHECRGILKFSLVALLST